MVIPGVVDDHHHTSAGMAADAAQLLEKAPEGLGVELVLLTPIGELPVAQANGTEVSYRTTRRMVEYHRIFVFGRNPHAAPGPVLLKVDLVHSPQVNRLVLGQQTEFF